MPYYDQNQRIKVTKLLGRLKLGLSLNLLPLIAQDHHQMVHNVWKWYCYHCSVLDNLIWLKRCHVSIFREIKWSLFHHNEAVTCQPLRVDLKGLSVEPASCGVTASAYRTECRFECADGYKLEGPPIKTCNQNGDWSFSANTYCKGTLS